MMLFSEVLVHGFITGVSVSSLHAKLSGCTEEVHMSYQTTNQWDISTHVTTVTALVTSHSTVASLISSSIDHTFQTRYECPPLSHVALGVVSRWLHVALGVWRQCKPESPLPTLSPRLSPIDFPKLSTGPAAREGKGRQYATDCRVITWTQI